MEPLFDIAIIGGGINGCGIARDAAGRGLKVFVCEQADLASATSSASTKLIHGGLRYLEYYEFRLVREALMEREVLLRAAPHIIWPMRFVLPHHHGLRPFWMLRLGLFLYDNLGGRKVLPGTKVLDLARDSVGRPLKGAFDRAFEYSDCWVQDARLVVLNAMDAVARGATVKVRTRCKAAERDGQHWVVTYEDIRTGAVERIRARALVNAAGPWASKVVSETVRLNSQEKVRLVKGSHIVVKKVFEHDRSYIFQNADGRIIFAIPYERDFTLIGTTDVDFQGEPGPVQISEDETNYLLAAAAEYFANPPTRDDVVWSYAGVRPLYDDGANAAQAATRDYVLTTDGGDGRPLLLNVFGGKITTYRRLAESAMEKLTAALGVNKGVWTADATLPGGDFRWDGAEALAGSLRQGRPFVDREFAGRLVRHYGTRAHDILAGVSRVEDLGHLFGADLYEREVHYLMQHEFATRAEDVLWRRSKLGLRFSQAQSEALDAWMAVHSSKMGQAA